MKAYYNELDAHKAETIRELILEGVIADGDVDERSIKEVQPSDLAGYTQCHFFAGGGIWSYVLRLAGWSDDRPVWTGSCPCPSFSAAGKGGGFSDPRHLWPDWFRLIRQCRPSAIFGEQADDAIGYGWLDLVQTDLEASDYAVGKAVFGACSVGAPHIRQRLYFSAVSAGDRELRESGEVRGSAYHNGRRREQRHEGQRPISEPNANRANDCGNDSERTGLEGHVGHGYGSDEPGRITSGQDRPTSAAGFSDGGSRGSSVLNGYWRDAIWLPGTDGKWRPTKSGIFPLAYGSARDFRHLRDPREPISAIEANTTPEARVQRLKLWGDAIVAEQAAAFVRACA